MTKYGWQHVAEEQGWSILVYRALDDFWLGILSESGRYRFTCSGDTEIDVLNQMEAWWRAQVTA